MRQTAKKSITSWKNNLKTIIFYSSKRHLQHPALEDFSTLNDIHHLLFAYP